MDVLTATDITKNYANHTALDSLSIRVPEQSIFGLLGPNGAGKTTLIRIINQIIAPDVGELLFQNKKMSSAFTRNIGYLPEERGLYKKMKVGEQALYLAQLKGLSRYDALQKLKFWFKKFEIIGWWNKKVEELSKGMQQKIQFIVTIIHDPKLLIFDEPFSGFDPINVNLLKEEILKLRENGATIIFSTHNMASVEELCDDIVLIDNAKKILEGNVREIKNTYKSNTFEVEYEGGIGEAETILPKEIKILSTTQDHNITKVKIQATSSGHPNNILSSIIPHAKIISFNEILPTMNEIFISKVNEKFNIGNN
ncbi:MAG: ATP-binding cassette domain-containing protein [Bacteroidales bacterium]|nr:ATP-binding cassette domain-containing protein [Bacteroidales bacterium]